MMISYSQNYEDVILSRAFPSDHKGFYIDVGAAHPSLHSVTRHFYLQGWRGINVEPMTEGFRLLCLARPRDINLNVGVSSEPGTILFCEVPASLGESSFTPRVIDRLKASGQPLVERQVPVKPLSDICREHVPAGQTIDFLKIDAEGFEPQVIAGLDWSRWRPRIVVLEGSLPHPDCERVLFGADYRFATVDGINRYYVTTDETDWIALLDQPVDPTRDQFVRCDDLTPAEVLAHEATLLDQRLAEYQRREAQWREMESFGPATIRLAQGLQRISRRHPRLSLLVKRLARIA